MTEEAQRIYAKMVNLNSRMKEEGFKELIISERNLAEVHAEALKEILGFHLIETYFTLSDITGELVVGFRLITPRDIVRKRYGQDLQE